MSSGGSTAKPSVVNCHAITVSNAREVGDEIHRYFEQVKYIKSRYPSRLTDAGIRHQNRAIEAVVTGESGAFAKEYGIG